MISALPSNYANAITPFSALGSSPVGEESTELKASSLKPLEAAPESARNESRRTKDEPSRGLDERGHNANASKTAADELVTRQEERQEIKDQQLISELASRDREVRAHERAHASVGGQFAGAPHYEYTRGPNGVSYATSGEVSISTGAISGDPEATITKARQIKRAAAAPADPSGQDRRVMAQASQLEAQAQVELRQLSIDKAQESKDIKAEKQTTRETENNEENAAKTRTQTFSDTHNRDVNISRRLIEIGVVTPYISSGNLVDQTV